MSNKNPTQITKGEGEVNLGAQDIRIYFVVCPFLWYYISMHYRILLRKSEYSCYTYLVVHKKMFILSFQIEDAMLMFDKQTMRHRGKIVVEAIRRALWVIRIFPQFSSILTIKISSTLFFQHFTLFRLKICFLHFIEEQL